MDPFDIVLAAAVAAFALAVLRVAYGPSDADRAVAGDLAFYAFVTASAVIGVRMPGTSFLTLVLVAALVGFLTSFSLARLIDRDEER